MYDYLILRKDSEYSQYINRSEYKNLFADFHRPEVINSRIVAITVGDDEIRFIAINCDSNGNYSYSNDLIPNKINLIEIQLPQTAGINVEIKILEMILRINARLSWAIVDNDENLITENSLRPTGG